MFFIYPASVSENCDKRIVPAVAKCIERFFLIQLQDAIASGVLPLNRKFDGRNYGPILLECLKNYNKKQMLVETKILSESAGKYSNYMTSLNYWGSEMLKANGSKWNDIAAGLNQFSTDIQNSYSNHDLTDTEYEKLSRKLQDMYRTASQYAAQESHANSEVEKNNIEAERLKLQQAEYGLKKSREDREQEIYRNEVERNKSKAGTGSYTALDSKIDIVPTSATVVTNVLYKGGPLSGKVMEDVEFNINVKVIPTIIKNFKQLENDLLDDYFLNKSENYFKSKGRNIARMAYNKLRSLPCGIGDAIWKFGMTVIGDDVDKESRKDVIYNTQGFVNASAFHKTGSSPNNYNYTSNIVIFNKDDLTDPDDANIFQNRSAMVKLFKMGWSTFCMLDPVEEMMYFISSLDGGYMHQVPYRYIMESYGSKSYYGTETKLKDSAKPFMIKRGNFSNFAKQFSIKRK